MNWRLSQLDRISITSFSDAHSPKPNKMGREATEFELTDMRYTAIREALQSQAAITDGKKPANRITATIEFFPEEGKYHWDGHRAHDVRMSPAETKKRKGICPKCGLPVTVGVEHRVEVLADRPEGYQPNNRPPFQRLIPLEEIIAAAYGTNPGTKKVGAMYEHMLSPGINEFKILRELTHDQLLELTDPLIVEGIERVRKAELEINPGYDGVYGTVTIFSAADRKKVGQSSLF